VAERPRENRFRTGVAAALVVALVIVVYGGYGGHWSWTGINGRTATLWDWLHLLMLPIAVALLPLWFSRSTRVDRVGKWVAGILAVGFVVVVFAGYLVPWPWTGFQGNTLWDWLNLLALPAAVALAPLFEELREIWGPRHSMITAVASIAFVVLVIGGYLLSWRWTGFTGNTLWNWLHLLLLPLLVPTVIVPALKPVARSRVEMLDESDERQEPRTG
jgi:uncharacterized membrane protein